MTIDTDDYIIIGVVLGCFVLYHFIHMIFFFCPSCCFRIKNTRKLIQGDTLFMNGAHRLGCADEFEETVPGAQKAALENGANILDVDVVYTKDFTVVMSHDDNMKRQCGDETKLIDCDYHLLPQFKDQIDVPYTLDSRGEFLIYKKKEGDSITFEMFQKFLQWLNINDPNKKIWINLEFKDTQERLVLDIKDQLIAQNRFDRVIWGCEKSSLDNKLYSEGPDVPRFAHYNEVVKLYLLYWLFMVGFYKPKFQCLQIPYLTKAYYKSKVQETRSKKGCCKWFGMYFYCFLVWFMNFTSRPLFKHLQKKGIHIMLYAVGSEEEIHNVIKKYYPYLDGLLIDSPKTLNDYLQTHESLLEKLKRHPCWGACCIGDAKKTARNKVLNKNSLLITTNYGTNKID